MTARQLSLRAALSPSYIGKMEKGELGPSLRVFARVAKVLKMTEREIMFVILSEGEAERGDNNGNTNS